MEKHNIIWWNLENLFAVESYADRVPWLADELKNELKGWSEEVLKRKISNLAGIISKVNDGKGPDIIGCCEIENESVLKRLTGALVQLGRNYKVAHKDTKDKRGIDVAFIFDGARYEWDEKIFSLEIMKRTATRDLVQINLKTKSLHNDFTLIGAHFPSRSGGQYESEPFRIMVGETLSYWIKRTIEIKKEQVGIVNIPIIVMGDFNDEPFNRSIKEYALAVEDAKILENAKEVDYLFNPMWELKGKSLNSYTYGNQKMIIDQLMVSKSIAVHKKPFKIKEINIISYEGMTKGEYNTPVRFSRPSCKDYNPAGYSDHLPVNMILEEE
jgi:endonuclease/exonuclease/phosphatase family metal-dependent hydrolase